MEQRQSIPDSPDLLAEKKGIGKVWLKRKG